MHCITLAILSWWHTPTSRDAVGKKTAEAVNLRRRVGPWEPSSGWIPQSQSTYLKWNAPIAIFLKSLFYSISLYINTISNLNIYCDNRCKRNLWTFYRYRMHVIYVYVSILLAVLFIFVMYFPVSFLLRKREVLAIWIFAFQ